MPIDASQYKAELHTEMEKIRQLMQETWGIAPNIEIAVEPSIIVSAAFNMKDFAHKGARKILSSKTAAGYRKPKLLAQEIMAEVSTHRNTCVDCGEDVPAIYSRLSHARAILWTSNVARAWGDWIKFDEKDGTAQYQMIDRAHPKTKSGHDNYQMFRLPLILPDAVERLLEPRRCKIIDKAAKVARERGWEVREAAVCAAKSPAAA